MSFDVEEKPAPSLVASESQNQMLLVYALAAACLLGTGLWYFYGKSPPPEPPPVVLEAPPAPKPALEVRRYDPPPEIETGAETSPTAAPALEESPGAEWRMRGKIYDLISLNPIPICMIVFIHPHTSARYETSTANDGSYKTIVPSLAKGGYAVAFSHPDYQSSYWMTSYNEANALSRTQRRQEAMRLVGIVNVPVNLAPEGKKPVSSEFFLIPKRLPKE